MMSNKKYIVYLPLFFLFFSKAEGQSFYVRLSDELLHNSKPFYIAFSFKDEFGTILSKKIQNQKVTEFKINKEGQFIRYIGEFFDTKWSQKLLYVKPNDTLFINLQNGLIKKESNSEFEDIVLNEILLLDSELINHLPPPYQLQRLNEVLDTLDVYTEKKIQTINKYKSHLDSNFIGLVYEYTKIHHAEIALHNFNNCTPLTNFDYMINNESLIGRLKRIGKYVLIDPSHFGSHENYLETLLSYLRFLSILEKKEVRDFGFLFELANISFEAEYKDFLMTGLVLSKVNDPVFFNEFSDSYFNLCQNEYFKNRVLNSVVNIKSLNDSLFLNTPIVNISTNRQENFKYLIDRHKGEIIYIDFWASWCAACKMEIEAWEKLKGEYITQNIAFITISIDNTTEIAKLAKVKWKLNEKEAYQMPPNSDLASFLTKPSIPRFSIINQQGKFINIEAPRPSDPKIREILDGLLEEK